MPVRNDSLFITLSKECRFVCFSFSFWFGWFWSFLKWDANALLTKWGTLGRENEKEIVHDMKKIIFNC